MSTLKLQGSSSLDMSSEEAQLAQCQVGPDRKLGYLNLNWQAYVQRHNIQQLVKEAIVALCIHKPGGLYHSYLYVIYLSIMFWAC